jgi:hypothetical protein
LILIKLRIMKEGAEFISVSCKRRLHVQGYGNYSDKELNDYKYGIRFAYGLCVTMVTLGLILGNIPLLSFASLIAFAGAFPPYHPFDYLYNYGVRHLLGKPKLPPRTIQGRFACGIASGWLVIVIYLLYNNQVVLGNIFGATLIAVGTLVTTTDICIPSMIYNALFLKKEAKES